MTTLNSLHELRQELDQLGQRRERLAGRLAAAADRLDSIGEPPGDDLIDDLNAYRTRTLQLVQQLNGAVVPLADDLTRSDVASQNQASLDDVKRLLSERECREQAVAVLDQVLTFGHIETVDFAPLALCQAEARRLKSLAVGPNGPSADAELTAVFQQTHPLNLLLKLCECGDRLSDVEWIECNDQVTATYGRQLATAIARGRIQRGANSLAADATPVPIPPVAVVVGLSVTPPKSIPAAAVTGTGMHLSAVGPTNTLLNEASRSANSGTTKRLPGLSSPLNTVGVWPRPSQVSVPNSIVSVSESKVIAPKETLPGSDSIFQPSPFAESVFDERTPPVKLRGLMPPVDLPPSASSLSTSSRLAPLPVVTPEPLLATPPHSVEDVAHRSALLSDMVVKLLTDNRLSLAMHLAQCAEFRPPLPVPLPPIWLLRSLVLAAHISESSGELAREMDQDLRNFRPELLSDDSSERRVALGYFLRAAALPAALISGANTATSILRAFKISPGCSQLYNYCSRIAFHCDRLNGQIVEMFRAPMDGGFAPDTQSMALAAEQWLAEAARKAVNYGRTSPLFLHAHWTLTASTSIRYAEATQVWCKWQEVLQFASRLLHPVINDDPSERNAVRQEITRLSALLRTEAAETGTRHNSTSSFDAASRGTVPLNAEMQAVLHKSIDFAGRWLRISAAGVSPAAAPLPPDAFDLRDEVLQRTAGVLGELNEQWQQTTSPLIRAGIACCRRSLERLHGLFEGRLSLPLQEIELRHALHSELLKVAGLELNEQWQPEADPATLERELFDHLGRGESSWAYAYDVHTIHGDHAATGRLLELNVWSSESKRESLRTQREAQIAEHRAAIALELDEVLHELELAANGGQLEEADGTAFTQRLDRLRRELPKQLNFGSYRWQLDQMRSTLQRRRTRQSAVPAHSPTARSSPTTEPSRGLRLPATKSFEDVVGGQEALAFTTDIFSRG